MTIMSMINGHTPVFQCIGDAYIKRDAQRFYYAYLLCIRAKTDLKTLHKYLVNRYNFNRSVCAQLLRKARIK